MIKLKGQFEYSYTIKKTTNIFSVKNKALLQADNEQKGERRFVLVDSKINSLYGEKIKNYFSVNGINTKICVIEAGDHNKNEENYLSVFKELCLFDTKRRSEPLIAIGGGVVTDLGGFVASTYRRGIPHIKVPTTLMGYIDASVGIKTGVNFGKFKNRMGTFEIPDSVILDKSFLKTLDTRNIINGIGEIMKLALVIDPILFDMLEEAGENLIKEKFASKIGEAILDRSIIGMANELSGNLYEENLQRKVDFGHTFSLIIESASNYQTMHGEAVAIDALYSCCVSYLRGMLKIDDLERIFHLYKKLGLPLYSPYLTPDNIWASVQERIMHRDGQQLIPIPCNIGYCEFINDYHYGESTKALKILVEKAKEFAEEFAA